MSKGLRPTFRNASILAAAVALLSAVRGPGAQSTAGSSPLSCASSSEKGKNLLGQKQFSQAENLLVNAAKRCPSAADIFDTLGLAYDLEGHFAEGQAAFRKAIAINPRSAGFHNNLAASLLRSGNQTEGVTEFKQALAIDPSNKTANLNLGSLYLAAKNYDSALRCFQAAQADRSQDPVAILELTEAYFGVGNARAARESAERMARASGLEPAMHFSLGLLLAQHGEYQSAAHQFAAIPAPDRDAETELNLGMAYSNLGRLQEARESYENALRRDPSNPDSYFHIGLDVATTGDHGAALDWLEQARAKGLDRADIAGALAEVLTRLGNFGRASDLLANALAAHPNDPALQEVQGDLLLEEGRPRDAITAYLQSLSADPRRVSARISLALAYAKLHQSDHAINELQQVLRFDPANASAKAQLGHLALESGQPDAASQWINQALDADPDNLTASMDRATLLERAGNFAEAQTILEKLVKLNPKNPQCHYLLSRVLAQLRRPEEAQTEFELSKRLQAPQNRWNE
jgi:superkiller protein 3